MTIWVSHTSNDQNTRKRSYTHLGNPLKLGVLIFGRLVDNVLGAISKSQRTERLVEIAL